MVGELKWLVMLAAGSGCMLGPYDDQRISSTTSAMTFHGYTTAAGAPVQVRAWDFTANAMANVGTPVNCGSTPYDAGGTPLYPWSVSRALPARFWRTGPAGGSCAAVGATTTISGSTYEVITVERDFIDCYNDHPSASDFYGHCRSDNSPVAKVYTTDWGSLPVDQTALNLAALVLGSQVSLTLDNYTEPGYAFCNTSNPAGCPAGHADDPETYKYFLPNGSALTTADGTLTFSITPSRHDPNTIYIDNMSTRASNRFTLGVSGGRLLLGINFEAAGPEIRMNCIRNGLCGGIIPDGITLDFTAPRAVLAFALAVDDGAVVFTDVTTTFTTGSTDGNTIDAGNALATAMTEMIMTDAGIRTALNSALDQIVRGTSGLGTLPLRGVSVTSTGLSVVPGCPLD